MIDIVERPSETGKLIHLNPRDWKCPRQIEEALFTEEHAQEDYGQYDKPSQYPAGTVAELRRTGRAFTQYIMKQDDGRWRKLTSPFSFFSGDLPMAGLSDMHFTLTILYNPSSERITTTMNILQAPNTKIGKRLSLYPEQFLNTSYADLSTHTYIETRGDIKLKRYNGTLHDLPVGTVIQFYIPCFPVVSHLVKQPNGTWRDPTIKNQPYQPRENPHVISVCYCHHHLYAAVTTTDQK